ncbi:hypothetical protein ARHIZOSPH14_14400 [Agromyces rhizosphaerae]|uniref:Tat pathway signal sequence domain protein n=1 Tax=Agromyces rhizosphaerae TaxID=88374 RepID=A0A9W6FRJ6_9MICO|nr:hypothetical protein [Agromyces rhizosphaerae]GLI27198.1 hypothetical protein ARHIZOSPH14_14400 [Agromyces rhizosphaerae]
MTEIDNSGVDQPKGISRRTVTKAMAWSVPAVAVAASVPAYAASPGIITLDGRACKLPGRSNDTYKGYAFGIIVTNPYNVPITVTITNIELGGSTLAPFTIVNLDGCTLVGTSGVVPAMTTLDNLVVLTSDAADSANDILSANYTITGGPGGSEEISAAVPVTPPVNGASCDDFTTAEKDCLETFVVPAT